MLQGRPVAVIPDFTRHHYTRSPRVELGYFFGSYGPGYEDRRRHLGRPTGVGNSEPVIAARRGDDAAAQSVWRRGEERIDRAARLERAGDLQRFELEPQAPCKLGPFLGRCSR